MLMLAAALVLGATATPVDLPSGSTTKLVLTLEAYRTSVVLYEPITLVYRLKNPTQDVIKSNVSFTGIEFVVTSPEGKSTTHPRGGPVANVILKEVAHEPGSVMVSEGELAWRGEDGPFPVPGAYEVHARVYAGNRPTPVYLESDPVRIEVRQPSNADSKAIASFASESDFKRLLRGGATAYCEGRDGPECFDELERFLNEHSDSAYAPTVTWDLASAVANGRLGVQSGIEIAVRLYKSFLKQWPDHPNAPKVMYGLALALDKAGRSGEAAEVIREFERKFPEQKEKARLLRTNSQSGMMLAPKP